MAFKGLAKFQELVTSGHSCKYLFFLWEQGRCQAKQLWLLSCRSPHGKGFPMTLSLRMPFLFPEEQLVIRLKPWLGDGLWS